MNPEAARSPIRSYALAAGITALALTGQWFLSHRVEPAAFLLLYPVVFLVSRFFGAGPAVFSIILSMAGAELYFLNETGPGGAASAEHVARIGIFGLMGGIFVFIHRQLERSRRELHRSEARFRQLADAGANLEALVEERTAKLRASEKFLDSLIENLPGMVFVKEADDLRFVRFNRAGELLTGIPREELLGKRDHDLFPKEQADFFVARDRKVLESRGAIEVAEEPILTRHNGMRMLHTKKVPILDEKGKAAYLLGISEDITDRKSAEEDARKLLDQQIVLREREGAAQRSTFLADASTLLTSSLDTQTTLGKLARFSIENLADWCTITLLRDDGTLERVAFEHRDPDVVKKIRELTLGHPGASAVSDSIEVIRSGKSLLKSAITEGAYERYTRDPLKLALLRELGVRSCMIVPMRVRERIIGTIVLLSTHEDRYYDEEDLRTAEELGRRAGIAVDNAELYRRAQDAIRLRDDFLSVASHELKTPLTSLKLQLETNWRMLQRVAGGALSEDRVARSIRISNEQLDRLVALVEDMLDIARIQGGRLSVKTAEAELSGLVREVCDRMKPQMRKAGCRLVIDVPDGIVAEFDAFRIEQVLANYLSNAARYAPGTEVRVHLEETGTSVLLTVRDGGAGLPESAFGRLFQRYERLSAGKGAGLGLGLYVSRHIVELHGGRVWAENHPDGGAIFGFELPARTRTERLPE